MPQSPQTVPGPTPNSPAVAIATLAEVTGSNDQTNDPISVHFNPVSLQLAVSNELKDTANNERKQYIAKASAKLTMDLLFDTTDSGEDVTVTTRKIQAFLMPPAPAGQRANPQTPPPLVLFEWGAIRFKGIAEIYKEVLDFFSANGVPLRATVNLTLSRQDQVFDEPSSDASRNGLPGGNDDIFDAPAASAAQTANALQNPGAARNLAAANGQESLRFGSGASLGISGSVTLKAPVAFSGGGSLSLAASAGVGLNAGSAVNPSAGGSAAPGIAAMARLSATEGAFSGLAVKKGASLSPTARLDPRTLMPKTATESMAINHSAAFAPGGKAAGASAGGLRTEVGASAKLLFD
jgi:hypothetical protein